jgi:hypothetical protein
MLTLISLLYRWQQHSSNGSVVDLSLKCDGTRAETRFRLSAKRTSPSAGASVQSTTGSRGVRSSRCSAGYTMFRGSVRVLATHSIRQFPLHFPSLASPCAITFQLDAITRVIARKHHYLKVSSILWTFVAVCPLLQGIGERASYKAACFTSAKRTQEAYLAVQLFAVL